MNKKTITIEEVPNEIDDHLLDIIGNDFKFDHSKGLAEWLKNSIDAYRTNGFHHDDQKVFFRFTDQEVAFPIVECIDFVGMSETDIEKAFKRWGDPDAAKRGKKIKVYGGHGNGGKFYMRQMFKESRFVTYKDGILNVFGFSENKKYGYAKDLKNKKMKSEDALKFAEINNLPIPKSLREKIRSGIAGFTVVQGIGPDGIKGRFKINKEIEKFKNHPQSRRILERASVSIIYNGESFYALLKPDELDPLAEFREPRISHIPETFVIGSGTDKTIIKMANEKYPPGKLVLKTSSEVLAKGGKLGELNRIDILGEIGVIGSYQLSELGVTGWPQAAFIYGEFSPANEGEASILEDPNNDCVSNDRSKLVSNETTKALVEWIAREIDSLAKEIADTEREKQKNSQREITTKFNDVLNEWKNKHMGKILSDLFGSGGENGSGGEKRTLGTTVSEPINGFDFKFPLAEIERNSVEKITLKISVPEALPIGAVVSFTSDSEKITLEDSEIAIKSDYLKSTESGRNVAFLNVGIIGLEIGAEATIFAKAGRLISSIQIKVVPEKEKGSGKSFPQVLLSNFDTDPIGIAPEGKVILGERDPIIYQRPQDVASNIYWINTTSPMASKIYDKFTFDSIQWRNFLFERYVDIFVKEAIRRLEKRDYQNFNSDSVDREIDEVIRKVHKSAKDDLDAFLFEEGYFIK